jgi:4-hydroxythreonine-4-phosphate dehydrogenase
MAPTHPRIAFVMGDPAGISNELAAKLLADRDNTRDCATLVIGDRRILALGEQVAGTRVAAAPVASAAQARDEAGAIDLLDLGHGDPAAIAPAEASAAGGAFALRNFRTGLELARDGRVDAVFFTPFNKYALKLGGNTYTDEIQFAADVLGAEGPHSEFNILGDLWNCRVTSHIALKDVSAHVTGDGIVEALVLADRCMRQAGFARPRIAVAALNPHAGDNGNFGREEIEVIGPAVERAKALQLAVEGPYPSDTVYLRARRGDFDGVLSMYHDQGQIAIKLMGFERGVTLLGGLPVAICTPAHGTAYDIAGKGIANDGAARAAFAIARRMGAARRARAAA